MRYFASKFIYYKAFANYNKYSCKAQKAAKSVTKEKKMKSKLLVGLLCRGMVLSLVTGCAKETQVTEIPIQAILTMPNR